MTPKEKAKELVFSFGKIEHINDRCLPFKQAKQCALIAVDEIIKSYKTNYLIADIKVAEEKKNQFTYWQEVRNEIEKL